MSPFTIGRREPLIVLVAKAGQPLVQLAGGDKLTQRYYDACKASDYWLCFYDIMLCGGEPYGHWY